MRDRTHHRGRRTTADQQLSRLGARDGGRDSARAIVNFLALSFHCYKSMDNAEVLRAR